MTKASASCPGLRSLSVLVLLTRSDGDVAGLRISVPRLGSEAGPLILVRHPRVELIVGADDVGRRRPTRAGPDLDEELRRARHRRAGRDGELVVRVLGGVPTRVADAAQAAEERGRTGEARDRHVEAIANGGVQPVLLTAERTDDK